MKKRYNVAIVGATGAVGAEMREVLLERSFPYKEIRLLASERSAGETINVADKPVKVQKLTHQSFDGIDFALFSAGGGVSKEFAPSAAKAGAIVIDNSSAWRMDDDVPLVVPEVNAHALKEIKKGIVANPNCSTIQMVVALKPLHDAARIKRIVVSTYQSVSGSGQKGMNELSQQTRDLLSMREIKEEVYPHRIAFNILPHIDDFLENGYTKEEMKMVNETRKILEAPDMLVAPTAVRVPVFYAHSESVNIECEKEISPEEARKLLSSAPGVTVVDEPSSVLYPLAVEATGKDDVFVGRIRKDETVQNGLALWVVADNIRKGAALNAVQIAEELIR